MRRPGQAPFYPNVYLNAEEHRTGVAAATQAGGTSCATASITSGQTGLAPLTVSVPETLTMRLRP